MHWLQQFNSMNSKYLTLLGPGSPWILKLERPLYQLCRRPKANPPSRI
jgi:hypothetical protein